MTGANWRNAVPDLPLEAQTIGTGQKSVNTASLPVAA
jgi:hypothetical protein